MKLIKLKVKTNNHQYPIVIGNEAIRLLPRLLRDQSIKFNQ